MDLSRMKKVFAGISATAIMLSQVGTAIAAYSDVPAGIWYQDAVESFSDAGYLDASQARFRGGDLANRAEFVKLVVELNGGILSTPPASPTFDDVAPGAWYFGYFEEAAKEQWVNGDGNCAGTHPCYARPAANINRAEAAAIIVRAFGLDQTGDAADFVDVPAGQWYTDVIQTAADHCVLQGDEGSSRVRPADNMNRAEMVVMLNRVDQNLVYGEDCGEVAGEPMISDVVATDNNTVEVDFNVSLDATAAKDKSKYSITSPAQTINTINILSDDQVELVLGSALEANKEYTLTVTDMMTADGETFSDSGTFTGFSSIPQGDGTLEVSPSSRNPTGDTVPKGAVGVVMTSVDLSASDDAVILENLTVLHEGFGDTEDISGVYALVNGERVTRKRSFDAQTTTATMRFSTPLVIPAGQTVTLDIAADIASTATTSGEHAITVELPSDVESNALDVTGNFPIRGAQFRIAAITAGELTVTYRSVTPTKVQIGEKKTKLGRFELSLDSVEDQTIYSMTVENDGTASDGDVTNLQIRRTDGTVLTNTVATTVGDFATFIFDPPFTILQGDTITLDVVGDIEGGAAKTVRLHFDETSDIFAVGSLYGYGVNGQLYGSQVSLPTETATLPTSVSIDAGQLTINLNGPATQNYTPDDKDAVLANLSISTGGEDVDVEELYIAIQGTTSTGAAFVGGRAAPSTADNIHEALEGVELRNKTTGRTISGVRLTASTAFSNDATGGSASGAFQIYRFDDFTVHNTEEYEIRVDFIDNGSTALAAPLGGDRFRVHVCGESTHELDSSNALVANTTGCDFGGLLSGGTASANTAYQMTVTGASTGDNVGDVRPGGTVSGNFQDIKTSALTITGRAGATTDTTVKNAKNVNLLRFEARASEAKDILITTLIFGAQADTLNNAQNYSLWVDSNGDGNVDTVIASGESPQSNQVTFDSIENGGYIVPKESTVVFEVHADISSSLSSANPVLELQFSTGSTTTYVQAEEVDNGSSVSGIQTNGTAQSGCTANSTCNIVVTTAKATRYTIRNQGDLYVTKSTEPVGNQQLLGGTLEDSILRLRFFAEFEDIEVTDIVLTADGANAATFPTNVQQLELYKPGATTPFALATRAACGSTGVAANSMCADMNNQQFIVTKGASTDVIVRPRMNTDTDGAVSGQSIILDVDPTPTTWSGTGSVRARGLLSSNTLSGNDGDGTPEGEVYVQNSTTADSSAINSRIDGSTHTVVLSKVTGIANANPSPNGSAIPLNAQPVGQFRFTTAAANNSKNGQNDWTLSGVIFNVNATNVLVGTGVTASGPKLYNKLDNTTKHDCTASDDTGSFYVTCRNIRSGSVNSRIAPGSEATFVLELNVINPSITGGNTSTLQVSLTNFTDNTATTFTTATSHISWIDLDNSSATTFRWLDYPETTINSTSFSG